MNKALQNLGLCAKAGGIIAGADMVIEGLRKNTVLLVFLASDASINTVKCINDKAKTYNVEVINTYSSEELSNAIGKVNRMVVGITNTGFAKLLRK